MAKKKIFIISDHPLVPSGVGTQAKYLIEGLLATNKFSFVCGGGAVRHADYNPQKIEPEVYGDDWIIYPVQGYGDSNFVRRILVREKPDAMIIFTDPRFFTWVWEMEDEIRSHCPLMYWHVWDNDPSPKFNKNYYDSTDHISALSLKTFGILQDLKHDSFDYVPHAVSPDIFKILPESDCLKFKKEYFGPHSDKEFILFWNNRNARRKATGDVIASFAKFAHQVGKDKVSLMMHTDPEDIEGQNVYDVSRQFDIEDSMIISKERVSAEELNKIYNAVDCTINIANAEGFGLGTLESIMSGTPIVAHMTGGLQYQLGDWYKDVTNFHDQEKLNLLAANKFMLNEGIWTGYPVFTAARSCTGSQVVPYIFDDRTSHNDVVTALLTMFDRGRAKRRADGVVAREWAEKTFNLKEMISSWEHNIENTILKFSRKDKKSYRVACI